MKSDFIQVINKNTTFALISAIDKILQFLWPELKINKSTDKNLTYILLKSLKSPLD